MKKILLLFLAASLSSCLTLDKIMRNCDKFAQVCVSGNHTETKWRDTVMFVDIPVYLDRIIEVPLPSFKDSVRIRDSVRIVDNFAFMKQIHTQQGIIAVDVSIYKSELSIVAYLTDSSILYNYIDTLNFMDSIRIFNAIKETTTKGTVIIKEKYIPGFYKFTFWFFIIAVVLGVVYIAWSRFYGRLMDKFNLF